MHLPLATQVASLFFSLLITTTTTSTALITTPRDNDLQTGKPGRRGQTKDCPPFSGNFSIQQYQLYPENLDFDFGTCVLVLGCLWNASVGLYDPYRQSISILEFPNITHNPEYHIGGVGVDERTGLLSIVVDAGAAFDTGGVDISGTNFIMQWDFEKEELTYKINLTETTKGKYGAFQDVEQDPDGNVYVVGTYPSSILRVVEKKKDAREEGREREWEVQEWYVPYPDNATTTVSGLSGLASKDWILLANDADGGDIVRFDMRSDKGVPTVIPLTPVHKLGSSDAIYLPPKYDGTVALVAEDLNGISVLRSKDGEWKAAEYLGIVPWNSSAGTVSSAAVQIGNSLYMNLEEFGDGSTAAGNRTSFPFVDITAGVEKLLAA